MYIDYIVKLKYYIKKESKEEEEKDIYYYIIAKLINVILYMRYIIILNHISYYILPVSIIFY